MMKDISLVPYTEWLNEAKKKKGIIASKQEA